MLARRRFLSLCAAASLPADSRAAESAGIIDTHTHFYDPDRPEGVPWPKPGEKLLYRRVFPAEYIALARPEGIAGTLVVEASPWVEDNQWVLDLARDEPFIVGVVGNLDPLDPEFAARLAGFGKNPLFRGIRLPGSLLEKHGSSEAFITALRRLADADLTLDLNGGNYLPHLPALVQAVPDLRVVIDHVGAAGDPAKLTPAWRDAMRLAAEVPTVFCKVSGMPEQTGRPEGQASTDPADYLPVLEAVWSWFGPKRVLFGSNWPVCTKGTSLAHVLGIVRPFFTRQGPEATALYFRGNAETVYRFLKR